MQASCYFSEIVMGSEKHQAEHACSGVWTSIEVRMKTETMEAAHPPEQQTHHSISPSLRTMQTLWSPHFMNQKNEHNWAQRLRATLGGIHPPALLWAPQPQSGSTEVPGLAQLLEPWPRWAGHQGPTSCPPPSQASGIQKLLFPLHHAPLAFLHRLKVLFSSCRKASGHRAQREGA